MTDVELVVNNKNDSLVDVHSSLGSCNQNAGKFYMADW